MQLRRKLDRARAAALAAAPEAVIQHLRRLSKLRSITKVVYGASKIGVV